MRRREFNVHGGVALAWSLLGGAASLPIGAWAQQRKIRVIGWLHTLSGDRSAPVVAAFREGLQGAGYVEGQNVAIESGSAGCQRHGHQHPILGANGKAAAVDCRAGTTC